MNRKTTRVCVIRHGYYPEDPRVYKEVRALVEGGHDVDVICLKKLGYPTHERIEGVKVYRIPKIRRRGSRTSYILEYTTSFLMISMILPLLCIRRHYNCIQVNTLPDALVFVTVLPKLFGTRVLLDMHEPTPELMLTKYKNKVHRRTLKLQCLIERLAIRYADDVITVNNTIRQRFIERGANPEKMSVVRNVPSENFKLSRPTQKPDCFFIIMTHGTLQPRYGQEMLLRTLPLIRNQIDGLCLIITGTGYTEPRLKQLAEELGCTDIVTFTGAIPHEHIADLISQASIGIVPLLPGPFSELCQPNKLFEYIALHVPVIASRLPAIVESFDDSCIQYFTAGNEHSLAEAILELARSTSRRKTLATNAFERYQPLCWHEAKKGYVQTLNTLINSNRHHRTPEMKARMSTKINGVNSLRMRLQKISTWIFTHVGWIVGGIIIGTLTGKLPIAGTALGIAATLAFWLSCLRPDLALCLFFCGIIMTSDALSLSVENCFVIPDVDIIRGLPSALTSFFLMLFCITMARRIFFEKRPLPLSLTGLGVYTSIIVLSLLTGLFNQNNPELLRVDLMSMFFPVLCFYLCITILDSRARINQLLIVLFSVTTLKALILMVFYLKGRGWMYQLDGESPGYIVTLDSADLLFCITFLLIAIHLLIRREICGVRAGVIAVACLPMLFAVIFSYRRAQWIGLALSLGLLYLGAAKQVRHKINMVFSIMLCIGIFTALTPRASEKIFERIGSRIMSLFDENQSSNLHHKLESRRVLQDLSKSPILGFGLGGQHSGFVEHEFNTIPTNIVHQTFLYIWMKTGLPGLGFFIWATVMFGKNILRVRKTHLKNSTWGLLLPLAASLGLWLAMFLSSPIPWYLHQTFFKALVAAIAISLVVQANRTLQSQAEVLP